jgi:hypothetical protein
VFIAHCNFDGQNYQGWEVPSEIKELLADKEIIIVQFDMDALMERLCAGGIPMVNWVDARNLALYAYPQPHLDNWKNMRDGRQFVTIKLGRCTALRNTESPLYLYRVDHKVGQFFFFF